MTTDNVTVVSFEQDPSAYEALSTIKELEGQGRIAVRGAAVVKRDDDGRLTVKDQVQDPHLEGTATGGFIGLLVGILGGPLGILIGGTTGLLVGSLLDLDDAADEESVLAALSRTIQPDQTVLLAIVGEETDEVLDQAMARLDGTVLRRSLSEVEAEIATAEEAQRAAERAARAELRAQRHQQLGDQVHEKVDALVAKL